MHIKVSEILAREVGVTTSFKIVGERPEMADLNLAKPLDGELKLVRTDFGLAASVAITTTVTLECHRCLQAFSQDVAVKFEAEFATIPDPEQWPIEADQTIDLAPAIRQEILVALPIKQLCQADCPGLCSVCGKRSKHDHDVPEAHVSKIRIVKGKK